MHRLRCAALCCCCAAAPLAWAAPKGSSKTGGAAGGGAASAAGSSSTQQCAAAGEAAADVAHHLHSTDGLRIGLIGGSYEPWEKWDRTRTIALGFVPDIARSIGNPVFSRVSGENDSDGDMLRHLERADGMLRRGEVDAVLAPSELLWTPGREREFLPIHPFTTFKYGIAVRVEPEQPSLFRLFAPFSTELWGVLLAVIVGGAAVAVAIDVLSGAETVRVTCLLRNLYYAVAALLGDDPDERLQETWPGRALRLGLLMVVLVIQATYTANLASMLTTEHLEPTGPQTIAELRCSAGCAHRLVSDSLREPLEENYLARLDTTQATGLYAAYAECADRIRRGESDAIVGDAWSLHKFVLSQGCTEFRMPSSVELLTTSWTWYFHKNNSETAARVSRDLLGVMGGPVYQTLLAQHFDLGTACGSPYVATGRLRPGRMGGLFMICGGACALATAAAVYAHCNMRRSGRPSLEVFYASEALILQKLEEQHTKLKRLAKILHSRRTPPALSPAPPPCPPLPGQPHDSLTLSGRYLRRPSECSTSGMKASDT